MKCLFVSNGCLESIFLLIIIFFSQKVSGLRRSSNAAPPGRPSLNWDNYLLQPSFDVNNVMSVIASAGNNAYIHCKINHLADRAVTWIRKADIQIMTVNTFTYTSDPRVSAYSSSTGDEWVLKIVGVSVDDSGGYECQVSTDPKMSLKFQLHVVVAQAEIEGQREVFMNSGGELELNCAVPRITTPPEFILWYNGSKIINYSSRKGIQIVMNRRHKSSRLIVSDAQAFDSGNYTCVPSNAKPIYVIVHILQDETPAAMQHGINGTNRSMVISQYLQILLTIKFIMLICLFRDVKQCNINYFQRLIIKWTDNVYKSTMRDL